MTEIIRLENVRKEFSTPGGPLTAVDGVSLSINAGEIYGIIGYSGAGKSTLVRLINGLETVTSGSVVVDGDEITSLSGRDLDRKRQDIGMIFQQFNLFSSRTLAGNVEFPLKVAGWPKAKRKARVAELLNFVGLLDRAHSYPSQLSGGQKQRVGIARALAAQPKVLLADEATSALDPETTADMLALLSKIREELGVTIVVITHELHIVRTIADRVAVMEKGKVAEEGTVFDVFTRPQAQITKRFVSTVLHDRPTAADVLRLRKEHSGRIVIAQITDGALLGRVLSAASDSEVHFEIIFGGISSLQDRSFGSLTLALTGPAEGVERVIGQLREVTPIEEVL